jgi:hypothetical protein
MELRQLAVLADLPHSGNVISVVNTRDDLNANDLIDWSDLGQSMTSISNLSFITSSGGRKIDICIPSGNFLRIDQTPSFPGAFNVQIDREMVSRAKEVRKAYTSVTMHEAKKP